MSCGSRTQKAADGLGLTLLLPATLGHNSDLDVVGQVDDPFHQTAAKNYRPSLLLGPGKEDLGDFVETGEVDQSLPLSRVTSSSKVA